MTNGHEVFIETGAGMGAGFSDADYTAAGAKILGTAKEVFATANYTAIFKFESAVSAASNKETRIAPSKKAVMLKLNTLDVITEKKSIENKINLTNR